MDESLWVAAYPQLTELALRVLVVGAVVLLLLESAYLLVFTVFITRRTGQHRKPPRVESRSRFQQETLTTVATPPRGL